MSDRETEDITTALREMPAWADVIIGDTVALDAIERAIRRISGSDLDTLMSGIRCFVDECRRSEAFDVSEMSKLFALNRYIFNVPEAAPLNQPRFGAFIGVPIRGDQVNELWPWQAGSDGELRLAGYFRGYTGETFLALEEADAFRGRFGPRRTEGPEQQTLDIT